MADPVRHWPPAARWAIALSILAGLVGGWVLFRDPLMAGYGLLTDRETVQTLLIDLGPVAPLVFIGLQIAQVIIAPVPGEASGFIGGYLFGAVGGFIYSSIGLTVGSWLNFMIGRFLGRRYARKLLPAAQLSKMDRLLKHQGVLVVFALFLFPGFPKDYMSLFLGMTALPLRVFIWLAAIGRMPGTLLLSLQGAFFSEKLYGWLAAVIVVSMLLAALAYRYRNRLYQWVERANGKA
jgi:uncharacterized membrane protein YdjX (TVP38/TMEM64 family)